MLHLGSTVGDIKLATCSHCAYTRMKRPRQEEVRASFLSLNNSGSKEETTYVVDLWLNNSDSIDQTTYVVDLWPATIRNCSEGILKDSGVFSLLLCRASTIQDEGK